MCNCYIMFTTDGLPLQNDRDILDLREKKKLILKEVLQM